MNDFVAYVEVLKINLDKFTSIQQKHYFLNRLKKKLKKKFNVVINMLIIDNAFATLTQRIKTRNFLKIIRKIKLITIETFWMKVILICVKNLTIALKIRKNARNSKIDLIIKIVVIISFVYFNKSRMKWIMIWKTIQSITTVIRKNILLKIVLSLSKRILKLTL